MPKHLSQSLKYIKRYGIKVSKQASKQTNERSEQVNKQKESKAQDNALLSPSERGCVKRQQ